MDNEEKKRAAVYREWQAERRKEASKAVAIAIIGGGLVIGGAYLAATHLGSSGASQMPCDRYGVRGDCMD